MVKPSSEMVRLHTEIVEKYPTEKECWCRPDYGVWCDFHGKFTPMVSVRKNLLQAVAAGALSLQERISDYLAYPAEANILEAEAAMLSG
ncbi:hypothetical protein GEOBRER4_n2807 [Citrifermentans bremense]|uniref:Uncharacterized protein n=1 Tax=Citrifermentans bremense TaxID=60035 RepID=A0A6S6M0S0_9BACT|nr:hypothetical protein [Citrifermentans bremense]BCG47952.1 hypothetical protein GEOBRER4_n2807 [Citrifermentans bremense]